MKVLTFGEILLRLASPGYSRLFQKECLETSFCGAEANVAVSLAVFGVNSAFLTRLPKNDVAISAVNSLRYFGGDTSKIVYGDGRMGLYYLEKGASQRPSKVIYDRAYSAISLSKSEDFDWDVVFKDIDWFHWTGIDPALSDDMVEICLEACKVAKSKGITISCDLNYRKNLWSSDKAKSIMPELMQFVDVCIANEEDADKTLGIAAKNSNEERGKLDKSDYISISNEICRKFGCEYVAITLRESFSASVNGWSGLLYNAKKEKVVFSPNYKIHLVDRVGGGDSFAAGLIYGLICGKDDQEVIDFAVASSCLKQTMEGDYNRATVQEIEQLICQGGNGRIQR